MSDIAEKIAAAQSDLRRLQDGWRPSEEDLNEAVRMTDWLLSTGSTGLPVLLGSAVDHPLLGTQLITTSPVLWMNEDQTIARTLSRWYRLSPPATPKVADAVCPTAFGV